MRFERGADRDGRLVYVKAEIYLDGGAHASSTPAVVGNAGTMGIGPYDVPNVAIDPWGVYTTTTRRAARPDRHLTGPIPAGTHTRRGADPVRSAPLRVCPPSGAEMSLDPVPGQAYTAA